MLVFDELKKNDAQLRLVALMLAAGLCVLIAGLWWVQVVSSHIYQEHLETQSSRTVRMPAARGKILDREGRVLAENQPSYNLSLFLGDLQKKFSDAYDLLHKRAVAAQKQGIAAREKQLGRSLSKAERKQFAFTTAQLEQLRSQARFAVASTIAAQVGQKLQQPILLDQKNFERACADSPYVPYPIVKNASTTDIARFEEQFSGVMGVDLDLQSVRDYPGGTTAAHLLGYVLRDDSSASGETSFFDYRLPDYGGKVGIEAGFDSQLRGQAGEESLVINSRGYRQSENILDQPEPGHNVVLTVDLDIQRAAEEAIAAHQGPDARAAAIVMDVHTGDILVMVSSPPINPIFVSNSPAYLTDPKLQPQINRATYGNYAPGSIFKPIVGLAALENGLNPNEIYDVQPDPAEPNKGCIYVGKRKIKDTVSPGPYNFQRAIAQSSNSYFIFNGLRTGIEKILALAEKFHFGDANGLPTRQESRGIFPSLKRVKSSDWRDGDSANICFGQGQMAVTPMQVAVAYSAIANGGTVLWPRLVERIEPQDPASGEVATNFPSGLVRDHIGLSARSLKILDAAMLTETETPEGSGYNAFHQSGSTLNIRVCGKTGTAQVENERNQIVGHNYWFASFAPYENPRYVVVVMVQSDGSIGSGGTVCAPIARDIYAEILKKENSTAPRILAEAN
jgi:penicillin-binding protein 2